MHRGRTGAAPKCLTRSRCLGPLPIALFRGAVHHEEILVRTGVAFNRALQLVYVVVAREASCKKRAGGASGCWGVPGVRCPGEHRESNNCVAPPLAEASWGSGRRTAERGQQNMQRAAERQDRGRREIRVSRRPAKTSRGVGKTTFQQPSLLAPPLPRKRRPTRDLRCSSALLCPRKNPQPLPVTGKSTFREM